MLFSLSHGQHVIRDVGAPASLETTRAASAEAAPPAALVEGVPLSAVIAQPALAAGLAPARELETAGAARRASPPAEGPPAEAMAGPVVDGVPTGEFNYYFAAAPGLPDRADMPALLDRLADSMVEPTPDTTTSNSRIPPIFTYLGQFIDHDITANTDREAGASTIEGGVSPLPRAQVTASLGNLRDGSLALDSLYGDTAGQGPFAQKLAGLMRHPTFTAKMRLGTPSTATPRMPLPPLPDNATDLLRLDFLMQRGDITLAELQALQPAELRDTFLKDGAPRKARAIIGDGRNDENLIVAQLHVLFLRLHNKLVDAGAGGFEEARRLTRWHYQWLVLNAYLPTICDVAVVEEVINAEAPLYGAFLASHPAVGPKMPMPVEFSVAAFRFGHSMVRAIYDHNRAFGKPVPPDENVIPEAEFRFLFGFTGNGEMLGDPDAGKLPQNWVIEWERWVKIDTANPKRAARKIDTNLADPLTKMDNEVRPGMTEDQKDLFRRLARRNLRRGHRLNVPTAQDCIAALLATGVAPFRTLTAEQIKSGSQERQDAVTAGGFEAATPLWFYVLKEAEVLGCGERLGPLGSHLVAQTLVGLVANDPGSYWNAPGGRWSPDQFDAANPIDSLEDVARFCGMLA
jgi:hypothetical protein